MSRTVLWSFAAESRVYPKDGAEALKDSEQGGTCSFCSLEKSLLELCRRYGEELGKDLIGAGATSVEERIKAQETDVYRKEKDGVGKQTDGVFGKCKPASARTSTPNHPPCLQGPASAL